MTDRPTPDASAAGTITIGGDLQVNRLGFGAMRLTGPGVWGEPKDPQTARRVLQRAVELGVRFIDTADSYGPEVSERLIREALHPYPPGLVIATKGGYIRSGPDQWTPNGDPAHLRQACEGSLRRLGLDRIDLYQFHVPDPHVPIEESLQTLVKLQQEGKIRHIGLSNFGLADLKRAERITKFVSVQNRYNIAERRYDDVVDYCQQHRLAFIPWFPLGAGEQTRAAAADPQIERLIKEKTATPAQAAIAWLLARSPAVLPIPGTSSIAHLEENIAAAAIKLPRQ
jgi:pyridoxine 4-dehydrogenase